ncbi:hypothetical protein GCM10011571_31650 [Marinithermofilum abyssi]|uniref:Uncharacterized protein n=1 Tax=Marinithermofilum abyssi TaxID=1571185 RepID=A0A8J2YEX0_9BACL|nr:hypothetical protein [Marinithermofilum abyssi]GGE27114.1 hypothetical protein GCM10011571_31650 [Marinithermofilum abyssi]
MTARAVIILINLALLGLTGWGTFQQIVTQKDTNEVMVRVHKNIRKAHELTVITNQQLEPLRETADTMESMNGKLHRSNQMLSNMNLHLANVILSEQKIVSGLDRLNQNMILVHGQLNTLHTQNTKVLKPASNVVQQTRSESSTLKKLYDLTGTSIEELAEINRKFAFLGYLP